MKKTIITMTMIFFLFLLLSVQAAKPITIVDHYKSLPDKATGKKISLTVRDGKWVRDEFQYGCGDPLVDVKNGYMEFECGGGGSKNQYVLFLKDDGTQIIGVSTDEDDGACWHNSSIGFYEYKSGTWSDVTAKVLPKMDYTMFLNKNYDKKNFNNEAIAIIKKYLQYRYDLPRYGLKAKIHLSPSGPRCVMEGKSLTVAELSILRTERIYELFRERVMEWDVKSGTFKLLNK